MSNAFVNVTRGMSYYLRYLSHIAEMGREPCTHPTFLERSKPDLPGNGTPVFAC